MPVSILKSILNATKDDTKVVALIKSTLETNNKKCWRHLQENKDFLQKHTWSVVQSCVADNNITAIKKIAPFCPLAPFDDGEQFLALQMCIDYDVGDIFQLIYQMDHKRSILQQPALIEDLLVLAWEKDADKQRSSKKEIANPDGHIAQFLRQLLPISKVKALLGTIDDPNCCRHLGYLFDKHNNYHDETKVLWDKWNTHCDNKRSFICTARGY